MVRGLAICPCLLFHHVRGIDDNRNKRVYPTTELPDVFLRLEIRVSRSVHLHIVCKFFFVLFMRV